MIIQITMVKNELPLLKAMLPVWKKFADGFVFLVDTSTDGSIEYLNSVKDEFNILEILEYTTSSKLWVETDNRQWLFDTALKYSSNIICLDADEYLDGTFTKLDLQKTLENNPNTVFHLKWVQYTSVNTIRVDGPWLNNYKDRMGNYNKPCKFQYAQIHSTHLPIPEKQLMLDHNQLFIAHMQWIDKAFVAIKQYFWKITDYVANKNHGIDIVGNSAYDTSVNNFKWEEEYTFDLLKINPNIFEENSIYNNYRLTFIKEQIKLHNIPDLGSWGYDFLSMDENKKPLINPYKVSVITAIGPLNIYEEFILRYISNVKDQHLFSQTEHIIVYSEYSKYFKDLEKLDNFKFIKEDVCLGVYNAWNIGIKNATTKYITNWNVDDIRHPINTKIKYDLLEKNDEFDLTYNWYVATEDINEDFNNIDINSKQFLKYPDDYHNIVTENCYAGPDPMWRKSLHDKVGYFDYENFSIIGDWEMWIKFAKLGSKFKLIPEVLCIYLDHNKTVSKSNQNKQNSEKSKLYKKYNG